MAEEEIREVDDTETGTQLDLFVKDHSDPMSFTEFASWMANNVGGGSVTKALEQSAFMLCCDVISQDIAKSTLRLRERLENGTSKIVMPMKHPVAGLLAMEPNRRHTWYEYVEMEVLWACLTSNAYAGVLRNRAGDPLELIPFQTGRVRETVEGRDVFYEVTASTQQEQALLGASQKTFIEADMIHVRGRMLDGMDGYSTLTAGKTTLDTGASLSGFRGKLFRGEGQVRGVFTRDAEGILPEEAFQRLRQQLKVLMTKFAQSTEPIVLEGGLKFQSISSKPAEIELTKQFEDQVNETCRLLRVPPHKVFALGNVKYENLETLEKAYVGDTLVPIAERFEQRYSKILLKGEDRLRFFFEHDRVEMTLRDTKVETERVIRAVERGVITFNEARAVLGYNPLPGDDGNARTIPVNMTLVGENNEILIGGTATPSEGKGGADADANNDAEASKGLRLISSK